MYLYKGDMNKISKVILVRDMLDLFVINLSFIAIIEMENEIRNVLIRELRNNLNALYFVIINDTIEIGIG